VRRSLDLTGWEAAQRKVRELEIHGEGNVITVSEACERFLADIEAREIGPAQAGKYKLLTNELEAAFGDQSLRSLSVDDVRRLRERWKLAPISASKKLERMRTFFSFCVSSGWVPVNLAKGIKQPRLRFAPTLPYSGEEWKKILWALDAYEEIHAQTPHRILRELKALVLLMRYSGLRISDAVSLKREKVDAKGRLFLYQAKTGTPVRIPLPKIVLSSLEDCEEGNPYYFWSGIGKIKSCLTDWQARMKKMFVIAGIADGHGHRLRDTFAVDLLNRGVELQVVSVLLGHQSIRTTERHYAPWVKSRQDALEIAVRKTW